MTSTDLPTHFPGRIALDRDRPQDVRLDVHEPATNTVRFEGSHLVVPVSGPASALAPAAGTAQARTCARRRAVRRVRVRRGRTVLRVRVTRDGRRARRAVVRLRGPGFRRRARTNRRGVAVVRVRARRKGRVRIATRGCGMRLRVERRGRDSNPR